MNLGTSYNMAADSVRLAPIALSLRTRVLGQLDFNLTSSLLPYVTDASGRMHARTVWADRRRPFSVGRINLTMRTTLKSGEAHGSVATVREPGSTLLAGSESIRGPEQSVLSGLLAGRLRFGVGIRRLCDPVVIGYGLHLQP